MIYGKIAGLDKNISRVVMGCAGMRTEWRGLDECFALFDAAYDSGINTYDTAVIYGDSEVVLGKWIERRSKAEPDLRDKIVVLTKGAHYNGYRQRLTPYDILSDLHESLAKTKLSCIDMYVLHRDDPDYPVGPVIDILNRVRDEGKIKIFGVSNWSHRRIEEANNYALKHHLEPIRLSSPNFTLGIPNRHFCQPDDAAIGGDSEAMEWYKNANMPVFAWSSLANGFFSGRVKSADKANVADALADPSTHWSIRGLYEVMANDRNFGILAELEAQAEREKSTVMQVALRKLIAQPFTVYPLFSTTKAEHVTEAAGAF